MTTASHMRSYDAVSLLGFGAPSADSLPDPNPGEIIIRYGGWSLRELRDSPVGKQLMHRQNWYDKYPWSAKGLPSGIYRLRIPVLASNRKTFAEQKAMLPSGELPAPVVLVATALLVHRFQAGEDLLMNDWTRCKETAADGCRVGLYWCGRLGVDRSWDDRRDVRIWLASARQTS